MKKVVILTPSHAFTLAEGGLTRHQARVILYSELTLTEGMDATNTLTGVRFNAVLVFAAAVAALAAAAAARAAASFASMIANTRSTPMDTPTHGTTVPAGEGRCDMHAKYRYIS